MSQVGEEPVRLRDPLRWFVIFWAAIILAIGLLGPLRSSRDIPFGVVWCALIVVGVALYWRIGATLTPRELVVQNVRRRTIPWSGITDVTLARRGLRTSIVIWTPEEQLWLLAPTASFGIGGGQVERDVALTRQWWLAHR